MGSRNINERYLPDVVHAMPQGFISLREAIENMEGILTSFFWSTNIAIQDSEGVTIFQTDVKNNNFIVMYENNTYVNKEIFLEIAAYATDIYNQLNRIYSVGDKISIRGSLGGQRTIFSIEILSICKIVAVDIVAYEIQFSIYPDVRESLRLFDYVITTDENINSHFERIDHETVRVELNHGELIDKIILSNIGRPYDVSSIQSSIRRIKVNGVIEVCQP